MKFVFVIVLLFSFFRLYAASPEDEIEVIQELIVTTKKNLAGQEKLLKLLKEFNEARNSFIENPTSAKLATQLVKISTHLKNKIEQEHLEHLFSTDLLTEVQFFTKVGQMQKLSYG